MRGEGMESALAPWPQREMGSLGSHTPKGRTDLNMGTAPGKVSRDPECWGDITCHSSCHSLGKQSAQALPIQLPMQGKATAGVPQEVNASSKKVTCACELMGLLSV